MYHRDTMKAIARAYLNNHERYFQEVVYHILQELRLRRILLAMHYVNIKLPEKRVQVLFPEKEHRELPVNSPNIFRGSNVDRYMEKPRATFCNGKNSVLDDFCYAKFLAYYTFENKSDKTSITA